MNVLFVDYRDSFSFNIVHALGSLIGRRPQVVEAGRLQGTEPNAGKPDLVVLGPGPGRPDRPEDRGATLEWLAGLPVDTPVFGVCFGMQLLVQAAGGRVRRAQRIVHGKATAIRHEEDELFEGLPNPVRMMRYHSWVVDDARLPAEFRVTAWSKEGDPMALRHLHRPIFAVQFHPESIGSPWGRALLSNLLAMVDCRSIGSKGDREPGSGHAKKIRASRRSPGGWFGVLVPEETRMRTGVGGKHRSKS